MYHGGFKSHRPSFSHAWRKSENPENFTAPGKLPVCNNINNTALYISCQKRLAELCVLNHLFLMPRHDMSRECSVVLDCYSNIVRKGLVSVFK